jgi:hypothetical protein
MMEHLRFPHKYTGLVDISILFETVFSLFTGLDCGRDICGNILKLKR